MRRIGLRREIISIVLSVVLVLTVIGSETSALAYQSQEAAPATSSDAVPGYSGQGTPETTAQLENLVVPIALYPDALVAQILNAATVPDQVAVADNWMQQNKDLTGSALGTAVNGQTWDPSVKALTQFPSVLHNMASIRPNNSISFATTPVHPEKA